MEASKTLRRPSNWQDFETLCKKLWGEIWNCPEIKKNGRSGQVQNGVDVYGIPLNKSAYYGIQCKGKDEYRSKEFSEEEITIEIKKAKNFQPLLKKLYFATTAVKDSSIESFVRKKNIENISLGLFEVHIFSWEDIVDLIDENRQTHDWYVNGHNYKGTKKVDVTFADGETEITCRPKFKQKGIRYTSNSRFVFNTKHLTIYESILETQKFYKSLGFLSGSGKKVNLSYVKFHIAAHNAGTDPIEEYKISLKFEGEIQEISDTNEEASMRIFLHQNQNTFLDLNDHSAKIIPKKAILVGDDIFRSSEIFIKPFPEQSRIVVKWRLISKDYKDDGELYINILPIIENDYEIVEIDDAGQSRVEQGEIEDYISEE